MTERAPFRLAFRTEGPRVSCYLAPSDTMESAHFLSAMPLRVLQADRALWEDWKQLMQRALTVMCQGALGLTPTDFAEETAPDHERSGNA